MIGGRSHTKIDLSRLRLPMYLLAGSADELLRNNCLQWSGW
jgi:hypothetical protein